MRSLASNASDAPPIRPSVLQASAKTAEQGFGGDVRRRTRLKANVWQQDIEDTERNRRFETDDLGTMTESEEMEKWKNIGIRVVGSRMRSVASNASDAPPIRPSVLQASTKTVEQGFGGDVRRRTRLKANVMRMNRLAAVALVPACVLALSACDKQVTTEVAGSLVSDSGPMADVPLRLYESYKACEGQSFETKTDTSGRFSFKTESTRGGISVVTQEIALCTQQSGEWKPLWSTITEGGAPKLVLTCKPPSGEDEFCDIRAVYDT